MSASNEFPTSSPSGESREPSQRSGAHNSPQNSAERTPQRTPPRLPPPHLRDPGDNWVVAPDGREYWGAFGAAGLLVWHREAGILLQHRAEWSHNGGTWGIPGGARRLGESAVDAAFREAAEEAGVPPELTKILFDHVSDLEFWSYTTVVVEATEVFEPVMGDAESEALSWISLDMVHDFPLHPGFAASWPTLKSRIIEYSENDR